MGLLRYHGGRKTNPRLPRLHRSVIRSAAYITSDNGTHVQAKSEKLEKLNAKCVAQVRKAAQVRFIQRQRLGHWLLGSAVDEFSKIERPGVLSGL